MDFSEDNSECWVFYWAAKYSNDYLEIKSPEQAYGEDENRGLKKTDSDGKIKMKLNCPQPYRTEGQTFARHVHYLVENRGKGIWEPMKTTRVICQITLDELDEAIKNKKMMIINALSS